MWSGWKRSVKSVCTVYTAFSAHWKAYDVAQVVDQWQYRQLCKKNTEYINIKLNKVKYIQTIECSILCIIKMDKEQCPSEVGKRDGNWHL